jgi:phage replication-related protein YjqB (UPF0714/DUF867 family)
MTNPYRNFEELMAREVEGKDFEIRVHLKNKRVMVMAPHGGKIEPMTTEIAEAISGTDFSFYSFNGLKKDRNGVLHIESHLFDEPRALQAVKKADIVVTIHGQIDGENAFVIVGGLHTGLCSEIKRQLEATDFETRPPTIGLAGTDPMNICNRGRMNRGVQLEISRKLRDALKANRDLLQTFANAIRRVIQLNFSK